MAVFNGHQAFAARRKKSVPVCACPRTVKEAFQVDRAFANGTFKLEPQKRQALYDRCYLFEDINYINRDRREQESFLFEFMLWLSSMGVEYKITMANEYQSMETFLDAVRSEKNRAAYPDIAEGVRMWQENRLEEMNPNVTTMRYLTVTCRADSELHARIYLNALERIVLEAFAGWGSRIRRLDAKERFLALQTISQPSSPNGKAYIADWETARRDGWKTDILPESIQSCKNFLILGKTYTSVLYGSHYRKTLDSDTLLCSLSNVSYPSVITLDLAPVETETVNDKLAAAQMTNDREITEELEQRRKAGLPAVTASYTKEKRKQEIENYMDQVDANDEKGFFMNLLVLVTAADEKTLAARVEEMQAAGKKEGVLLNTCDYRQLKAWNTALPMGGRQVDYMRFFLTSSLVAFQPYHATDIIEPGGQMLGINRTTRQFIIGNRKALPNPHGIIVGYSGTGKSMLIKLTELAQTLLSTEDDIMILDPQNEFEDICREYYGAYFDLTPKSGVYLNGFEVSAEVFHSTEAVQRVFVAAQTEYAKTLCAAAMKNIGVTQEHDSVISRCTERMFRQVFAQKRLKRQPTLLWLREEIGKDLEQIQNRHDEEIIRPIYNCLEEYTTGSCDMLARPSNLRIDNRLVGFGMAKVPENNWEAVMVTVLHYLSVRMDFNKKLQRATHLIVDEAQVVSKKPGSANQLNHAVITFRKFGGIVTMAMQNVTAALSNPVLVELFANCSYKVFLDQGGVDAQSLAEIQEFSEKEYRALSSDKPGFGVMVWNKKIVLFDARVEKENPLYEKFNTNFHEKVKKKQTKSLSGEKESYYLSVQRLAALSSVSAADLAELLPLTRTESEALLAEMEQKGLLLAAGGEQGIRYTNV